MAASKLSLVGSLIENRYLVEEELGSGGMSAVHVARDLKSFGHRKVVVKTLLEESRGQEYILKKFRQEAEALSRLEHPNIINVLSYGELPEGQPYLILQYVEGKSLRHVIHEGCVELERCARILRQIASALTAAHEKGVLHRDLKPENVMLQPVGDDEEQVKVIDFGIAKIKDSVIAQETVVVTTAGTIAYMSPEQLAGRELTPASDVYALGVIAYEMVTGRKPFNVESPFQLPEAQRAGVSVKPTELRPDLPPAAEGVILKALSYEPQARFARAKQFGDQLYEAITGMPAKRTGLLTGNLPPRPDAAQGTSASPFSTTPMLDARVTENQTLLRADTAPEHPSAADAAGGGSPAEPTRQMSSQLPQPQQPISQPTFHQSQPSQPQQTVQTPEPAVVQTTQYQAPPFVDATPARRGAKRWLVPVLALLVLVAAGAGGLGWWALKNIPWHGPSQPPSTPTPAPRDVSPKPETVLTYWVSIQKFHNGEQYDSIEESSGRFDLENGWKMRLHFEAQRDGYLYVINDSKDPQGKDALTMQYPNKTFPARLLAHQVVDNPWARIVGSGTEKFWVIWSSQSVAVIEDANTSAWNAGNRDGVITDESQASAVRDFLLKSDPAKAAAEEVPGNGPNAKRTNIKGSDDPLIYLIEITHH